MTNDAGSIFEQLNAPFLYEEYAVNHDGFVSVSPQATADRLNQVIGPLRWTFQIIDQNVDMEMFYVSIFGKIAIQNDDGEWIEKSQFGDATMVIKRGERTPTAQAINDAKKKAASDCMKKCASLLSVASDVYRGRLTALRNDSREYRETASRLNLDTNSKQFKNGIVILPDSYKSIYEGNNWKGIFQSDIITMATLMEKYISGNGSEAGFNAWFKRLDEKGASLAHMDYVLQDALNKKGAGNQTPKDVPSSDSRFASMENRQKEDQAPLKNKQPEGPISGVYQMISVEGEDDPYYKLVFNFNGTTKEIMAVGPLMERIDVLNLQEGSTYSLWTRTAKGRNVLRDIRKAV
ncbi:Rad52/Rad22 family DNA repair protein [Cohnella sp. AR92]|uniref:Rad52/Rad22 family DNA repair protein n=1 Tax=Cohnella sp. AR92 TaxID=648716 RepID=UPI000F8D9B16|nr:Rad52/Rad22 family DNA repair protein [Cohnella sp. AR92]RUS44990.1 hypothetical protein ELR57_22305 [Cohnella sp. AR92]